MTPDKPSPSLLRMYHDAAALDAVLRRLGCDPDQSRRVAATVAAAVNTGPVGERVAALGRVRRWAQSKARGYDVTIWKFPLKLQDEQVIQVPAGSHFLSVQYQGSTLCLWAWVDPAKPMIGRVIRIVGTGHPADDIDPNDYIGTVQQGPFVWHVFQI